MKKHEQCVFPVEQEVDRRDIDLNRRVHKQHQLQRHQWSLLLFSTAMYMNAQSAKNGYNMVNEYAELLVAMPFTLPVGYNINTAQQEGEIAKVVVLARTADNYATLQLYGSL
jgi:hypothetical protein